jgi:hypothetical protein
MVTAQKKEHSAKQERLKFSKEGSGLFRPFELRGGTGQLQS